LAVHTTPVAAASALQGAVMHAVAHGLAKASMFAAVGALVLSMERDDINHLGGVSSHMPLTLFTFGLAGITLMGLPPSSGFLAKWLLIDGALVSGQWGWVVVLIVGGLLTAAYVFRVLRHAFLRTEPDTTFKPLPRMLIWPPFVLAIVSLALGLRATEVLELLVQP
jgi:multicomponent Na+:H+ antiporter subunit D